MADIGYDSEFGIEGSSPGVYVKVADVTAIAPPGMTRDSVEVTDLESPDMYKEYIPGLKDGGEATITLNFRPSATDVMVAAFENDEVDKYQITFPNGVMLRFSGFFTGYTPPELTPGGNMIASGTIKCTGKPTLHASV
jgi:predicted secreted protein